MTRCGRFILFACLLLFVAATESARAQSNATTARVAILDVDPDLGAANDMLTAAFSKRAGVGLLERAQIEKIFREQQLSAANQDLVKLGQILGADGLVILQTVNEGTNRFLQSRLVAVKPGVVLAEFRSPWPLENLVQWSGFLTDDFSPLFPKLTVLPKDAVALSILNLRSPLHTMADQELERELTVLLIHRLTRERDVFVLERQHLSEALAEKEFTADESPFWTGRYLLDGSLDKDGFDPVTATISARLASSQGGEVIPIEVSGPRTNLNALAESLVGKVLAALHHSPTVTGWNPAREADQFFDEAQWAYQWKLLPESAAAAESAWALGRHDKAAAELRIRAYCDQDPIHWSTDPSQITLLTTRLDNNAPKFNFTTKPLALAIRVQELFCRDWRLGFTNASQPDVHWYDLGLGVVRAGAAALEFYYYNVELRPGHEEELARLRSLLRQTVSILETNDARPSDRTDLATASIRSLEWQMTGYWVEKPEDALPVFRRLVEKGIHPVQLPVLAGWSWADRQRLSKVLRQWLGEVSRDTNMPVRLEGLTLSLIRAPDDGSRLLDELENDYLAAVWENRRWILDNRTNLWPLLQAEESFRQSSPLFNNEHLHFNSFAAVEHRIEMDYLANSSSAKQDVFTALFDAPRNPLGPHWDLTPFNATDLLPLMEKFQPPWLTADRLNGPLGRLRRAANVGLSQPAPAVAKPVLPEEESVEANFNGWNLRGYGSEAGWRPALKDGIFHEHMLLFKIDVAPPLSLSGQTPANWHYRTSFVSVNPKTGVSKEIDFPDIPYSPYDRAFDFSADSLFVTDKDKIYRHRFDGGEWEAIPVPIEQSPQRVQLVVLNGRVYISAAVNLLELDPDSRAVRIIASSRRRPPENEMDTNWDPRVRVYSRADGKLGAVFGTLHSIDFDPVNHAWEYLKDMPIPRLSGMATGRWIAFFYSPEGALALLSGGPSFPHRLLAFGNNETNAATLLADTKWEKQGHDTNLLARALMDLTPRWAWPTEFGLDTSFFLGDGRSLWILTPRKFWYSAGNGLENVQFSDNRQATLFHFVPEFHAPLLVPIRFQNSNPECDPLDSARSGLQYQMARGFDTPNLNLLWFDTPESLVLAVPNVVGHWQIPKSSLEARFRAQRESLRNGPPPAAFQTTHPPATNAVQP